MSLHRSVVAVGGSAGGINALQELVASLPVDLPAPVLVTVHVGDRARSKLPEILSRAGLLNASHARHGEPLRAGHIYVAPPDVHLLVGAGLVRLSSGPRVNRHRPAVDVMLAGTARWAGSGAVAVVLSGLLDDGAVGAALVARAGGHVIVQDPAEAAFDSMPRSALRAVPSARVVPTAHLGKAVCEQLDIPVYYYRCYVGHQYSPRSLEAAQREAAKSLLSRLDGPGQRPGWSEQEAMRRAEVRP